MTEQQVKEQLSRNFVKILASNKKFKTDTPDLDNGVDLRIYSTYSYNKPGGGIRISDTGNSVELQLKATTENQIVREADVIKYDLEAKSYNDLIMRRNGNSLTQLLLVLFILPPLSANWVEIRDDELLLRKHAYWYYPDQGLTLTPNATRIRISIPVGNKLDLNFCPDMFNKFGIT